MWRCPKSGRLPGSTSRIPQARQDYCMAHGTRDLHALYEPKRELSASLAEDTARLAELVGERVALRLFN